MNGPVVVGLADTSPPPPLPPPPPGAALERRNTRASARAVEQLERSSASMLRCAAQIEAYPVGQLSKMLRWDPGSYTGTSSVIKARQLDQEAARVQALCGEKWRPAQLDTP